MVSGSSLDFGSAYNAFFKSAEITVDAKVNMAKRIIRKKLTEAGKTFFRFVALNMVRAESPSWVTPSWRPLIASRKKHDNFFYDKGDLQSFFLSTNPYKYYPDAKVRHVKRNKKFEITYEMFRGAEGEKLNKWLKGVVDRSGRKVFTKLKNTPYGPYRKLLAPALNHYFRTKVIREIHRALRAEGIIK